VIFLLSPSIKNANSVKKLIPTKRLARPKKVTPTVNNSLATTGSSVNHSAPASENTLNIAVAPSFSIKQHKNAAVVARRNDTAMGSRDHVIFFFLSASGHELFNKIVWLCLDKDELPVSTGIPQPTSIITTVFLSERVY